MAYPLVPAQLAVQAESLAAWLPRAVVMKVAAPDRQVPAIAIGVLSEGTLRVREPSLGGLRGGDICSLC